MFESVKGQQYCLEVNSGSKKKNTLAIKKNEEIVDQTSAVFNSGGVQLICLDSFDAVNDILEIKNGAGNAVKISVKLINNDTVTSLHSGQSKNLNSILIDDRYEICEKNFEVASAIKIQNGVIIQSACAVRHENSTGKDKMRCTCFMACFSLPLFLRLAVLHRIKKRK